MDTTIALYNVVELFSEVLAFQGSIWQLWWVQMLVAAVILTALVVFEFYRSARMKELSAALDEGQQLKEKLRRRIIELGKVNRTLALEYHLTRVLAESDTLSEAAPPVLQAICESAEWEVGALWEVDEDAGVIRCVETSHLSGGAPDFEKLTRDSVFEPGFGLPGRVWQSGTPHWVTNLSTDENFPRIACAVKEGLRSAYGFPSLLGDRVTGVLEFFSHELREPDEEMIKWISAVGNHIGQLIERKRAEEALRDSEVHFRSVAESASDAMITVNERSEIISLNPAVQDIFGYPMGELVGAPLTMLMPEYIRHVHRAGIGRYLTTNQKHISWRAAELPGLHKDGHEIPLEISFCEWTRKGARYFTGIVRDVTERKLAEEALRRTREERLRELERVRTRIAADLHDDIGSSLTKIVILSDVAQQKASENGGQKSESLNAISDISNELVEAMSDIVWAINPRKDRLSELSHRMRRFASDMFTARSIKFQFRAAHSDDDLQLGANVRREVFLIFKESVNNVVKHSHCTEATAQFSIEDGRLTLQIKDNGQGFKPAALNDPANGVPVRGGNGLPSMRQRAMELGGEFKVTTAEGQGTTVWLSVPIAGLSLNEEFPTPVGGDSHA
jgi:PAS domain S-box-containing protein